jgi:hypothetical protein
VGCSDAYRLTAHPDLDLHAKKQSWQPKPVGAARDESWFFIGVDPRKATKLIVPESRWDALSILSLFTDAELQTISIISALGVSQISLPLSPTVTEIICAAQNDTASKQWAAKLAPQCRNKTFKLVLPPSEYKDYNDALRKGSLSRDIFDNAKPCTYNFSTGQLSEDFRPIYEIYGGPIESIPALENGIKILAVSGEVFNVGGMPMWLQAAKKPQQLDIEADRFDFNLVMQRFAQTFYVSIEKGELVYRKGPLGVKAVGLLMGSWDRAETKLPPVSKILATPNLVRKNGNLELPKPRYHPDCDGGPIFIVNEGRPIPEISFEEGRRNLLELISEFDFLTENDRSRMIACMIAPAMQSAGFIQRWYPLAYFEAQEQGSGKSSLMEIIPAIYAEEFASAAPPGDKSGGVGSLDNSISAALGLRKRFLCIDNVRGPIKSTLAETALTSGRVQIRSAYCAEREINCDGVIWMITSNNSTMTPDLMERSLTIKLRGKPRQGSKRNKVEQMALITERQPELLGSVYAMIREWYKAGCPVKSSESRHRFTNWAHSMCGVVETVMGLPEMLEGIELDTRRLTDEDFAWARNMGIRLQKEYELVGNNGSSQRVNMLNKDLFAKDLVEVSRARDLYPPGENKNSEEIDIVRSIGTVISRLPKQGNALDLGGFRLLTRIGEEKKLDKKGRSRGTTKRWIARWEEV